MLDTASVYLRVTPRTQIVEEFSTEEDYSYESTYDLMTERLSTIEMPSPKLFSAIQLVQIKGRFLVVLITPEVDGGYIAKTETEHFNALGQGETEEEALEDIKSAIELLIDEETNPSDDLPWPNAFR